MAFNHNQQATTESDIKGFWQFHSYDPRNGAILDISKEIDSWHKEALHRNADHYIQNYLPIRLLQLSNMVLVDRAAIQKQIGAIIKGTPHCGEFSCDCWEKMKVDLKYSILSHRWGSPELTFSEFGKFYQSTTSSNISSFHENVSEMWRLWKNTSFEPSLDKLLQFQNVSTQRQCKYGWVDTICINKESSAELDESIRSMYAWYRDSHICIVHLNQTRESCYMKQDPWFTRGWTLQELLAPKRIKFFSASWKEITQRENDKGLDISEQQAAAEGRDWPPLWSTITKITGIPIDDLLDFKPGLYDIGKRMHWASRRTTTRVEDMAYCLIGIFRVNLSISYGEKEGAFYRLQAEIMQNCNDKSLFDWNGEVSAYNSMFAASPKCFFRALGVNANNSPPVDTDRHFSSMANFERRVSLILYHKSEVPSWEIWQDPRATACAVLGPLLFRPGKYALMLLEQVGTHQHYKRLEVIDMAMEGEPFPEKSPIEILIK